MDNKKIAIIRNAMPYDFGGGERFPVFLADTLVKQGFNPVVISRHQNLLKFAQNYSVETVSGWWWSQQNWSGWRSLLTPVYFAWQMVLILWYIHTFIRLRPAAIHIQSKDDFIAATIAGALLRKRVVWTDHADLKHIFLNHSIWYKNPVGKAVYLFSLLASSITVVSRSELNLISENLSDNSRVLRKLNIIHNGVIDEYEKYQPTSSTDAFTYCVASRLVADKGIAEVISAFTSINKKLHDTKLILLGDGPEADKFKSLAANNSAIDFKGYQTEPLKFIAAADVFVHPTYHEGFSVALVEASMLAKPIVATSVGGNLEIIHNNKTGLLVKPQDSLSLVEAMRKLYENPELRKTLGQNARKQYKDSFEFNKIVKNRFIPLYEDKSRN